MDGGCERRPAMAFPHQPVLQDIVPFCMFQVRKRGRNHFRCPQDDPEAEGSQDIASGDVFYRERTDVCSLGNACGWTDVCCHDIPALSSSLWLRSHRRQHYNHKFVAWTPAPPSHRFLFTCLGFERLTPSLNHLGNVHYIFSTRRSPPVLGAARR